MEFVKIYTTRNEVEASVIRGVLRVYGIETDVRDGSLRSAGYPGVPGTKGGGAIEIWVNQDQADLALKVVEEDANLSRSGNETEQENVNGFLTKLSHWLKNG